MLIDGIHGVYKLVNLHNRVPFISHIRRRWGRQRLEGRDCRRYVIRFSKNDNIMSAYRRNRIITAVNNTVFYVTFKQTLLTNKKKSEATNTSTRILKSKIRFASCQYQHERISFQQACNRRPSLTLFGPCIIV